MLCLKLVEALKARGIVDCLLNYFYFLTLVVVCHFRSDMKSELGTVFLSPHCPLFSQSPLQAFACPLLLCLVKQVIY